MLNFPFECRLHPSSLLNWNDCKKRFRGPVPFLFPFLFTTVSGLWLGSWCFHKLVIGCMALPPHHAFFFAWELVYVCFCFWKPWSKPIKRFLRHLCEMPFPLVVVYNRMCVIWQWLFSSPRPPHVRAHTRMYIYILFFWLAGYPRNFSHLDAQQSL